MTERKPADESVGDFVERQILEAQERGDFDDLEGHGRPLEGLGQPDDELWWVRRKLRDEQFVDLPPALQARRARDDALAEVVHARDEVTVRQLVARANSVIRHVNRTAITGPPTATMPLDVEDVVAAWRRARPTPQGVQESPVLRQERPARRWWSLLVPWRRRRRRGDGPDA